ncbi:glycosyltransferase family 39 protein [Rossellomorea aquimaris]|uniref:Dolichyl-phosphate-mannose-protein mannosyltransferase n=1 Tax=Rossellomorea aquimaris TaxID=189382 RepID=A0A366EPM9_9BACI|nr:glycosyltransferase family 39 protein [Rossellomorea aquimaris]RBP04338.1 dolichyl-phosphate-mannose-protein mannosyltransferase [Rossellomorea aquimaris]
MIDKHLNKWMISILVVFSLYFIYRLILLPPYASSWDEVDYALGVIEFDLLKMQPHFPGYPFFIFGGMMVHIFVDDPVLSLQIFNTILLVSSILPVYWLFGHYLERKKAIIATLFLFSLSYPSVMTVQAMSEGAAIPVLWWYLWSLHRAVIRKTKDAAVLPILLFAILMGIRLSYIGFGAGILYYWFVFWKESGNGSEKVKAIAFHLTLLILSQGVWLSALAANAGSLQTLLQIALGFTDGHFTEWGGTVESDTGFFERLWNYIFINIGWNGLFTQSLSIMVITALLFLLSVKMTGKWTKPGTGTILLLIAFGSYFIWGLFAQNIDKPRHILPLAILAVFFLLIGWMKKLNATKIIALSLWFILHIGTSVGVLTDYHASAPAVYKTESYFTEQNEKTPIVVYTWEETRVYSYLDAPYSHKRVLTYSQFLQDIQHTNKEIYLTGAVVKGFEQQGIENLDEKIEKVQVFHSQELFDPVYSTITVYKWADKKGERR